jgi:uncharacterized protein
MEYRSSAFNEQEVLGQLRHYLPAQAPLKDFIHHNTLHSFQHLNFYDGLKRAAKIFGYKTLLSLDEYRKLYQDGVISDRILDRVIVDRHGADQLTTWKTRILEKKYDHTWSARIGTLRATWKKKYDLDPDINVHPVLFRIICSYLDQGIAIRGFPVFHKGLISSIRQIERVSAMSFFKTQRAKRLLFDENTTITDLLNILVGDAAYYTQYLFDQQFAHQGWSGLVSVLEKDHATLVDKRDISLNDFILLELLLEIDNLDHKFGEIWAPLCHNADKPKDILAPVLLSQLSAILRIWQDAYEWTYYDSVLGGIATTVKMNTEHRAQSFQAVFCIDDRELSLRDYIEKLDPSCATYATPGFFSAEFYYLPQGGKSLIKQCPAPLTPKYLIREKGGTANRKKEFYFTRHTHSLFTGWLLAQTLGLWSVVRLVISLFKPSLTAAAAASFTHMDPRAELQIERKGTGPEPETGLLEGFTPEEMADRVYSLLMSIGLAKDFAPFVYLIGHGASSMNNPHYAAYNCGACCGRPGSVNARVAAYMANHVEVRKLLAARGLQIPAATTFVGGLHDTTRDEIFFYDVKGIQNIAAHQTNVKLFNKALRYNAKERSRRFELLDSSKSLAAIHRHILNRSVSLFEPRPELNHATNALCVVGRRALTQKLFLDRRAFTNSYDYRLDPEGKLLLGIVRPLGPVCGGINLEYFFSRVDFHKLGSGTKLPHNVMGLIGVANGTDGDLRPGLPVQMTELHDPLRLMIIIEHDQGVILKVIQQEQAIYEWFINEWIHLAAIDPSGNVSIFKKGEFIKYDHHAEVKITTFDKIVQQIEKQRGNLPVQLIEETK